ncbi:hypothetical protein ACXIUT_07135 [Achromobacter denitrificans]
MSKNKEPVHKDQADASSGEGGGGAARKSAETFGFYLAVINQCFDLVFKLTPVFMLAAGIMLWSFLREIGWTHLLLPTASSSSGLAFLAISALVFVGAAILLFLAPSLFLSPGLDFYAGRLTPARVKWILAGFAVAWTAFFAAIGLVDGLAEILPLPWFAAILYGAGLLGYAWPGFVAACEAWEKQSAAGQREADNEKQWRALFFEHWLKPGPDEAGEEGPVAGTSPEPRENAGSAAEKNGRKAPSWFAWLRPLLVVCMALVGVIATSFPLMILSRLWGDQLALSLGTVPAFFLMLACATLAVSPGFAYLHIRSQNVNSIVAAKCASAVAFGLAYVSLFAMMYAPVRDRVFHALEIQSPQKEYFLVSSPVAAQALGMLGFPLAAMPASVSDWRSKPPGAKPGADTPAKPDAAAKEGAPAKPAAPAKPDTPMIVQAWVGYSFGDTVLLCRWRAGERVEKRDAPFHEGSSGGNACLPLARSELRRLPNVWPEKTPAPPDGS